MTTIQSFHSSFHRSLLCIFRVSDRRNDKIERNEISCILASMPYIQKQLDVMTKQDGNSSCRVTGNKDGNI